ncbi:30S ribosomal protein S4 [Longimicrobium terrae]|uniref:Small ribosomal subunit protein uS4 n=1 Tax=Longimicrobium terrae TaxID=1639882 RepID=A0A841GVW6_9BACT|nr:30S ribosomal protein S4 [Longimicrobium terrae]MBB4634015.1 small subunit ribosomal protein S4 [Longimicrobium terrae]MBB6069095.1 small subunit ribosomal protein S4 [Longimicrobium terrae]NNC28269.1 30S ribosomal protein S4 [Longimicrobium terrae]
MPQRGPRLKRIRRLGTPLPGLTRKAPEWKSYPPGAHGPDPKRRRSTPYRARLDEKQKLRWNYGVSERQLRTYFEQAAHSGGVTGEELLALLERRLDNVVFRLGFAPTIPAARQLVAHGHIRVNGARVDRAGFLVKPGHSVAVGPRGRAIPDVMTAVERGPEVRLPGYLALDPSDKFTGRVVATPMRGDVPFVVEVAAIVEFYAR